MKMSNGTTVIDAHKDQASILLGAGWVVIDPKRVTALKEEKVEVVKKLTAIVEDAKVVVDGPLDNLKVVDEPISDAKPAKPAKVKDTLEVGSGATVGEGATVKPAKKVTKRRTS